MIGYRYQIHGQFNPHINSASGDLAMLCGIRGVYVGAPVDAKDSTKRAGGEAWRTSTTYNNDRTRVWDNNDNNKAQRDWQRKFGGPIPLHDSLTRGDHRWRERWTDYHVYSDYYDYNTYGATWVHPGSVVVSDASSSAYVVFTRAASPGSNAGQRTEQVRSGPTGSLLASEVAPSRGACCVLNRAQPCSHRGGNVPMLLVGVGCAGACGLRLEDGRAAVVEGVSPLECRTGRDSSEPVGHHSLRGHQRGAR
jgi:hypothetical protein